MKRRKRQARVAASTQRPQRRIYYENYEINRERATERPIIRSPTTKTPTEPVRPKVRNEQVRRPTDFKFGSMIKKAKPQEHESSDGQVAASEIDALNDEEDIYEQLTKRRPVTKTHTETVRTKVRNEPARRPTLSAHNSIFKKPKQEKFEISSGHASELDALNEEEYNYEELEKTKSNTETTTEKSTESNEDVEQEKEDQPNQDMVFIHGLNHHLRKGKQRKKYAQISNDAAVFADITDDDSYEEYQMKLPDSEVEMHDLGGDMDGGDGFADNDQFNFGQVRQWPNIAPMAPVAPLAQVSPLAAVASLAQMQAARVGMQNNLLLNARLNSMMFPKRFPQMGMRPAALVRPRPNKLAYQALAAQRHHPKLVPIESPIHKQTSERVTITKKLKTPDELHDAIDKIFQSKHENYNKKGHDKSHWELRIMPSRYKTHEA